MLDIDSTAIPAYGQQEQSAHNGHFESACYHPLLMFNQEGDCLAAKLPPGNVHSAEHWEELPLPEIERQGKLGKKVVFRAHAAFAKPEIYEALEERAVKYAIRIATNDSLERDIAELLTRKRKSRPCADRFLPSRIPFGSPFQSEIRRRKYDPLIGGRVEGPRIDKISEGSASRLYVLSEQQDRRRNDRWSRNFKYL